MASRLSHSLAILAAGTALVCLHCAQPSPPPGGPVDDTPPSVLATDPPDGAFAVSYPLTGTFYFSEKMDRRSVERDLRIYPEPDFLRIEWERGMLTEETGERPVELLHITFDRNDHDTVRPTIITIGGGAQDRRKNGIPAPVALVFTNGKTPLPDGRLCGIAAGAGKKVRGHDDVSITVEAYRIAPVESGESSPPAPYALTSAGRDGRFRFQHLPRSPERVRLRLYRDDDQDGALDMDTEYYGFSDTLALSAAGDSVASQADSVTVQMVNAETPAELAGTLLWASPESLAVELTPSVDSLEVESATPDSAGAFSFRDLPAGTYRLSVIRKAAEDRGESAGTILETRSIDLQPGEKRTLPGIGPPKPAPGTSTSTEGQEPQVKE